MASKRLFDYFYGLAASALVCSLTACNPARSGTQNLAPSDSSNSSSSPAPTPRPPAPTPPPSGKVNLACTSKLGGSWNFGNAPSACSVTPLQNTAQVLSQYPSIYFDDKDPSARANFMSLMYPVVRDVGTYYIKRRNPSVTEAEIQGFLQGLFTLAHQESFWSHYRKGVDGLMRYMRGDSEHGHGLMQVDDRSHAAALQQGKGVDLVENMLYGLDIFYSEWLAAANVSCVSSASNYQDRARAAWAAYNGGRGSICRWKNGGAFSGNDVQFLAKYNARAWLGFVANPGARTQLDILCLAEGARPCTARANALNVGVQP